MIRYFEVYGLDDEPEAFGFMNTVTDQIIEVDGCQFFSDHAEFLDYLQTSGFDAQYKARMAGLIPDYMKRQTDWQEFSSELQRKAGAALARQQRVIERYREALKTLRAACIESSDMVYAAIASKALAEDPAP